MIEERDNYFYSTCGICRAKIFSANKIWWGTQDTEIFRDIRIKGVDGHFHRPQTNLEYLEQLYEKNLENIPKS